MVPTLVERLEDVTGWALVLVDISTDEKEVANGVFELVEEVDVEVDMLN